MLNPQAGHDTLPHNPKLKAIHQLTDTVTKYLENLVMRLENMSTLITFRHGLASRDHDHALQQLLPPA